MEAKYQLRLLSSPVTPNPAKEYPGLPERVKYLKYFNKKKFPLEAWEGIMKGKGLCLSSSMQTGKYAVKWDSCNPEKREVRFGSLEMAVAK
jgi:hypothetical protein